MNRKKDSTAFGFLVVITGASGTGKDSVMSELLRHKVTEALGIKRVVTCTDRPIREGEPPDAYHFLSPKELESMAIRGELVEEITLTGTSRKATSKAEISRLLSGENLVWRIDPSRAAEVATGVFFKKHFPDVSAELWEHTLVVCLNAPKAHIESRREKREGKNYNPGEFALRDKQESPHIDILLKEAVVVENADGKLPQTVEKVAEHIMVHHEKIKNKRN